ncbi:MAG: SDR family oxidoreductase [Pseudomonadota bacterium]
MLFANEIAVVTGAASNLGAAISRRLSKEGADVVLTDIDEVRLGEVARDVVAFGHLAHPVVADLSTVGGWRAVMQRLDNLNISMLVHSACPPRLESETVGNVTEDEFDRMLNVNVRSGFFLARAIAAQMVSKEIAGRMLFITSLHAETPRNLPHYAASKAGLTMLMKELARYYGPANIRINSLAPGAIPGGGFQPGSGFDELSGRVPLKRFGTADEIAATAMALLSNSHTGYVTGTELVADGGISHFNWINMVHDEDNSMSPNTGSPS